MLVSFPSPNPSAGKDLVTLEPFLGSTGSPVNRNLSCKNQESAQLSPDPFSLLRAGSGDETIIMYV